MSKMTITEALAEVKLITKKINNKFAFVTANFARSSALKDPFEKDGGAAQVIGAEWQAIADLQKRLTAIRSQIQKSNLENAVEIEGHTATVAEWLAWRKEVATSQRQMLQDLNNRVNVSRTNFQNTMQKSKEQNPNSFVDQELVFHLNPKQLAERLQKHDDIMAKLDGRLSAHNAVTTIEL